MRQFLAAGSSGRLILHVHEGRVHSLEIAEIVRVRRAQSA
jgi:hypothetical protein